MFDLGEVFMSNKMSKDWELIEGIGIIMMGFVVL